MTFSRKPYVKPPRAMPVRSSLAPCTPAVMRPVGQAVARVVPAAPAKADTSRATPAEREHMGRVKALACVLCRRLSLHQDSPTEVHHVRTEQGGAQRASHFLSAALCGEGCHRGPRGIHGDRSLLRQAKCTELDLLAWTLEDLAHELETS